MLFSAPKHPLQKVSDQLRLQLLDLIHQAGGGHIGGPLSSIDIMVSLYNSDLFNFKNDHFILSAGHLAPALYTVLAHQKFFPKDSLSTYSQFGSKLQGHVSTLVPGVEYSSGSLGQGLSFAAGLSLGDQKHTTVCLTTDGEHQQGQIWEAVMFAKKYNLSNLINIIDQNGFQIDGSTDQIMPLGNLAAKYISFGWTVYSVNGHDFSALTKVFQKCLQSEYPNCIIAKTTFGKGISFMEKNFRYHDVKNLSQKLYLQAKKELESHV